MFVSFTLGHVQCPVCSVWFHNYAIYLRHIRSTHGPAVFPYTCGLCFTHATNNAPCYRSLRGFMKHWERKHPEIPFARDVVHPVYGNHYLSLEYQTLREYISRNYIPNGHN